MTYLLLASGISLAVLALLLWQAPRGWQDQDGFHLGKEPYTPLDTIMSPSDETSPRKSQAHRKTA